MTGGSNLTTSWLVDLVQINYLSGPHYLGIIMDIITDNGI